MKQNIQVISCWISVSIYVIKKPFVPHYSEHTALSDHDHFKQNQMFPPGQQNDVIHLTQYDPVLSLSLSPHWPAALPKPSSTQSKQLCQAACSVWSVYRVTVDSYLHVNRSPPAYFIPWGLNHEKALVAALLSYFDPHQLLECYLKLLL